MLVKPGVTLKAKTLSCRALDGKQSKKNNLVRVVLKELSLFTALTCDLDLCGTDIFSPEILTWASLEV